MMVVLARPLTVVAHDAGAANHIFAWLRDEQPTLRLLGPCGRRASKKQGRSPPPNPGYPLSGVPCNLPYPSLAWQQPLQARPPSLPERVGKAD